MTQIETIQRDLACPSCEYNLRGLSGSVVDCPECGTRCDVAALVARKWTGPWHQAPGLAVLEAPGMVIVVGALLGGLVATILITVGLPMGLFAVALVWALVWAFAMFHCYWRFRGWTGVWLAIPAHGVSMGYMVALLGVPGGVMYLVGAVVNHQPVQAALAVLAASGSFGIGYLAYRIECYVARRCVRHYIDSMR